MPRFRDAGSAILALLVLAVAAAPAAAADVVEKRFTLGAGAGPTMTSGDASDALGSGFHARGFLRFNIPAFPLDPRADFTYHEHDISDPTFASPGFTGGTDYATGTFTAWTLLLEGQLKILPLGPVQVYAIGGAGTGNYDVGLEDGPGGATLDGSASAFTWSAGLGASVSIGGLSAFLEGRMLTIENERELLQTGSLPLVPVTLGLQF